MASYLGWKGLLDNGLVTRALTPEEKKLFRGLTRDDMWDDWILRTEKVAPHLLTPEGKSYAWGANAAQKEFQAAIADSRDQSNRMGKYAPPIAVSEIWKDRQAEEGDCTEKQRNYLITLGVQIEPNEGLGWKQASAMISAAELLREKRGI